MLKLINTKEILDAKFLPPYDSNDKVYLYQRGWNDAIDAVIEHSYIPANKWIQWIPVTDRLPEPPKD